VANFLRSYNSAVVGLSSIWNIHAHPPCQGASLSLLNAIGTQVGLILYKAGARFGLINHENFLSNLNKFLKDIIQLN